MTEKVAIEVNFPFDFDKKVDNRDVVREKAIVFIDGKAAYAWTDKLSDKLNSEMKFDFPSFKNVFQALYFQTSLNYFNVLFSKSDNPDGMKKMKNFMRRISYLGYNVFSYQVSPEYAKNVSFNTDICIQTYGSLESNTHDTFVFLTNDRSLVPLIKDLRRRGKKTILISLESSNEEGEPKETSRREYPQIASVFDEVWDFQDLMVLSTEYLEETPTDD